MLLRLAVFVKGSIPFCNHRGRPNITVAAYSLVQHFIIPVPSIFSGRYGRDVAANYSWNDGGLSRAIFDDGNGLLWDEGSGDTWKCKCRSESCCV